MGVSEGLVKELESTQKLFNTTVSVFESDDGFEDKSPSGDLFVFPNPVVGFKVLRGNATFDLVDRFEFTGFHVSLDQVVRGVTNIERSGSLYRGSVQVGWCAGE